MRSLTSLLLLMPILVGACHFREPAAASPPKRIVDLSPTLTEDSTCRYLGQRTCDTLGVPLRQPFAPVAPADPNHSFGMMIYSVLSHGGAHLDAPGRLLREGDRANQVSLDRFYGPARIWDLRWHDRYSPLQINDLDQQPPVQPGEILVLFIGYSAPTGENWPVYSWLSPQAASWLAARSVRALATDMPSIGNFQREVEMLDHGRTPEDVWSEHLPFFQAGIPVIEGLTNLEQLVHEPKVTFVGFPLPLADRSGAPLRAAALVY